MGLGQHVETFHEFCYYLQIILAQDPLFVLLGYAMSYLVTTDCEFEIVKHYLGFHTLGEFKKSPRLYHTSLTTSLKNKWETARNLNCLFPVMDGVYISQIQFHAKILRRICLIYQDALYWLRVWSIKTLKFLCRRMNNELGCTLSLL